MSQTIFLTNTPYRFSKTREHVETFVGLFAYLF